MGYKVLYRKYRPDSFKEIIGQNFIVETLKNSVENNNFSHAYIFTGPRGTGKTSTAKVLAKSINCENIINGEACGKCESCKSFNTSPDIIEIDAASNNGVDEIRELRNNISLAPSESKYKVYIIDEVHMLSTSAFNALLKTLEEPPSHAIFILATTEVYKVPITILSRCQRFDFMKINKKDLINHLKIVCEKEKIEYEDQALDEIYELSEGCVRDSLSILDQSTKDNKKLIYEKLLSDYNIVSTNSIKKLISGCFSYDIESTIKIIEDFENSGINVQRLIKKIINYLEDLLINNFISGDNSNFDIIKRIIYELDRIYVNAKFDDNVYTIIKLIFIETMTNNTKNKTAIKDTKNSNEDSLEHIAVADNELSFVDIRINNTFVGASKTHLNNLIDKWNNISFVDTDIKVLSHFIPVVASANYAILSSNERKQVDEFNNNHSGMEKKLKEFDIKLKLVAITTDEWNKIKLEYIDNIKKGFKYKIINEKIESYNNVVDEIFDNQIVEIV